MIPENRNSKPPVTIIDMAGYLFFVVGIFLGLFGDATRAPLGASLVIFAGLCFVAAAVKESAAMLRKRD